MRRLPPRLQVLLRERRAHAERAKLSARATETRTKPGGSSSIPGSVAWSKPGVVAVDASPRSELIGVRNANADAPELERGVVAARAPRGRSGGDGSDGAGDVPASDLGGCQSARARTSKGSRVLSLMVAAYGEPSEGSVRRHAECRVFARVLGADAPLSVSDEKQRLGDMRRSLLVRRHGRAQVRTAPCRVREREHLRAPGSHAHEGTRDATSSSRPKTGWPGRPGPRESRTRSCLKRRSFPAATAPSARSPAPGVTLARPTCLRMSYSRPASLSGEPSPGEGVGPGANATRSPCISFAPVQLTRADTSICARTSSDVCLSPTPRVGSLGGASRPSGRRDATAGSGAPLRPDARSLVEIVRDRAWCRSAARRPTVLFERSLPAKFRISVMSPIG